MVARRPRVRKTTRLGWPGASLERRVTPVLKDVRDYIDRLHIEGHTVYEDYDDDPILIDPYGKAVDTWRENYPYDERMPREEYDESK